MELDLDTSWIEKEEKRFSLELNHLKTSMDSISCYFIYIDENLSIQKVIKENECLNSIDSNVGILNSRIIQIVEDRRHLNNGMKYKLMSLIKYVIDLDVENINEFAYGEEGVMSNDFLKEISMFNDVIIESSLFIFHPLNSLYFFLKEDHMVIKPIKSILRSSDDSNHSRYSKKVRIIGHSFFKSKGTRKKDLFIG